MVMRKSDAPDRINVSAFYEGVTWHERHVPFHRRFSAKMWLAYFDVDEIPQIDDELKLLSTRRFRPLQFRRKDYFDHPEQHLGDAVRNYILDHTGEHIDGKVFLLSQLRTWGWCFNPLSLYYCFDAAGELRWIIAEVTNTPWKERTTYLLPVRDGGVLDYEEDKQMHVSPLWPMSQRYRFNLTSPAEKISVRIENIATEGPNAGDVVHAAGLELKRVALNDRNLLSLLVRRAALTHRVTLGIHRHAALIKMRGATFYSHPKKKEISRKGKN